MLSKINLLIIQLVRYFPIFLIKRPFGKNVPFHAMMPAIGYFHIFENRSVSKYFLPLIGIFLLGVPLCLYHGHYVGLARIMQTIGLIFMGDFFRKHFEMKDYVIISRTILILSLVYLVGEFLVFGIPTHKYILPGVRWPRFLGLVGESNFSAICIALLTIFTLFFDSKKYFVLLGLISLSLFASRIAVLLFALGTLGILIKKFLSKFDKIFVYVFSAVPFFFPIFIFLIENFATDRIKLLVEKVVNGRYVINACYLKMFSENLFGVGYFRGRSMYKGYAYKGTTLTENGIFEYSASFPSMEYEHHNLFMQTLSELGIIGYGLLGYFVFKILSRYTRENFLAFYLFAITLVGFSSLNGYNEFILYFIFAFLIYKIEQQERPRVTEE